MPAIPHCMETIELMRSNFPVLIARYDGVVSFYVPEEFTSAVDEAIQRIAASDKSMMIFITDDDEIQEYEGRLEGLEELQLGYGQVCILEDEGGPDETCPNCLSSLKGTCSFCAPIRADVHVRMVPGYNLRLINEERRRCGTSSDQSGNGARRQRKRLHASALELTPA